MFLSLISVAYISTSVENLSSLIIFTAAFVIPVLTMVLPTLLVLKSSDEDTLSPFKIGQASLIGAVGVVYFSSFWTNYFKTY